MEAAAQLSELGVELQLEREQRQQAFRMLATDIGRDRTDIFEARGNAQTLEEKVSGSSRRSSKASNVSCNHKRISS